MKKVYIISLPTTETTESGFTLEKPGFKITLSNDKSLVGLETFYSNEVTGIVEIQTILHSDGDELSKAIEVLQEIKYKIRVGRRIKRSEGK